MFVSYDEETTFSLKKKFKWETNEPHLQYFKSPSTITLIYTKFLFYFIIQNYYYFCILASYFLKTLMYSDVHELILVKFLFNLNLTWQLWALKRETHHRPIEEMFHHYWIFICKSNLWEISLTLSFSFKGLCPSFFLFIFKGKLSFWSLIFDACVKNQNSCQRFKYDSLVFNLLVLCPNNC